MWTDRNHKLMLHDLALGRVLDMCLVGQPGTLGLQNDGSKTLMRYSLEMCYSSARVASHWLSFDACIQYVVC